MIGLPYGEKKLSRYAGKTRMIGYCDDMLSCFHLIPERHGQTDRQTDRQNCYINIARQCADAR